LRRYIRVGKNCKYLYDDVNSRRLTIEQKWLPQNLYRAKWNSKKLFAKPRQGRRFNSPAHHAGSRTALDAKSCQGGIYYFAFAGLRQEADLIPVALPQAIALRPCGAFQTAS
jgi:hypothetical protein